MSIKRGALIVFEGCDRSGKTTQCKKLVERLKSQNRNVRFMNFPNRTSQTGQIIDSYLRNKANLNDQGIHLLFSANRWEARSEIEAELKAGTTLIIDRYSFSGVAFTAAKGLDFEWCKAPEIGLPKPDMVVYLTLSPKAMARRGGFGDERYETSEIQQKVQKMFEKMIEEPLWQVIDADKTEEKLCDELEELVVSKMNSITDEKIDKLW